MPSLLLVIVFSLLSTGVCSAYQVPPGIPYSLIPSGPFLMGENDANVGYYDEGPLHWADIPASFAIMQHEVTHAQYAEFLNSVGVTTDEHGRRYIDEFDPDIRIERVGSMWQAKPGWENHPMVEVSWYGADAFCRWLGGRLPTEEEWEKAARGTDGRKWPWGNEFLPPGEIERDPLNPRCSYWWGNKKFLPPPVRPYPVGSFPGFPSPHGLHDMAGNAWEWTTGGYASYPGGSLTFDDHTREVQRGGSWTNSEYNVRCATRSPQARYTTDSNLGFRVVWSNYEPVVPDVIVPPRMNIAEWVEDFSLSTPMDAIHAWWGNGYSFTIDANQKVMIASLQHPTYVCGEYMALIRRNTGGLFAPGDFVDITVRLFYERGDRGYARTSVGVAWGDNRAIVPGGRGADENFGFPWYLIANNTDAPGVWHEVTAERMRWGTGKFCIGFGLWGNLPNEAIPPIVGHHRMFVDSVTVRHSKPDYPFPPVVTDDGAYTSNLSELHAVWHSDDPFPISEYQYAIGTSPDDLIVDWTFAGTSTSASRSDLTLVPGATYYWYVRARYDTMWSDPGMSNGIAAATPSSVGDAKSTHVGVPVTIDSAVVTSRPADNPGLWVISPDRSAGLRIPTQWSVALGDILTGAGSVQWIDGVPTLVNPELKGQSPGPHVRPVGFTNSALANDRQEALVYSGINPVGLYVTIWGRVTSVNTGDRVFYVNDGSNLIDGMGSAADPSIGIRVSYKEGVTAPQVGDFVVVSGIRTVEKFTLQHDMTVNGVQRLAGETLYVPVLSLTE